MRGERIKQINNIIVSLLNGVYYAWDPNGNVIYSNTDYNNIIRFCENNKSFLQIHGISKKDYLKKVEEENRKNDEIANRARLAITSDIINGRKMLFHGSNGGLHGEIRCNANTTVCDFGSGFYTGEILEQAESRISNKPNGVMYGFELKPGDYSVYNFDNDILWALFVGYNRNSAGIEYTKYKKLMTAVNMINSHDIIVGKIADDKIAYIYNDFMLGNITDACLVECLKLVKYGTQTVFKNDAIANHFLNQLYSYRLTKQMRSNSVIWNKSIKINMETDIEQIKMKFRRKGKFIDERLEELK